MDLITNFDAFKQIIIKNNNVKVMFDSKETAMSIIKKDSRSLRYMDNKYCSDIDIVYNAISDDGESIYYACNEFKSNRQLVLKAVSNNGMAFQYISKDLQYDREVIFYALSCTGMALQYVPDKLKNDISISMQAITQNGYALKFVPENLKSNRSLIVHAIKSSSCALQFVPEEFKEDEEIVLFAIQQKQQDKQGHVLTYAADKLKYNESILLIAIRLGCTLNCILEEMSEDNFILYSNKLQLEYTENGYIRTKNTQLLLEDLNNNMYALDDSASFELKYNKDFILEAVKIDYTAIRFAHNTLKTDLHFVLNIIKQDSKTLVYLQRNFLQNKSILLLAFKTDDFITFIYNNNDRDLIDLRNTLIYTIQQLYNMDIITFSNIIKQSNLTISNLTNIILSIYSIELNNSNLHDIIIYSMGGENYSLYNIDINIISTFTDLSIEVNRIHSCINIVFEINGESYDLTNFNDIYTI